MRAMIPKFPQACETGIRARVEAADISDSPVSAGPILPGHFVQGFPETGICLYTTSCRPVQVFPGFLVTLELKIQIG